MLHSGLARKYQRHVRLPRNWLAPDSGYRSAGTPSALCRSNKLTLQDDRPCDEDRRHSWWRLALSRPAVERPRETRKSRASAGEITNRLPAIFIVCNRPACNQLVEIFEIRKTGQPSNLGKRIRSTINRAAHQPCARVAYRDSSAAYLEFARRNMRPNGGDRLSDRNLREMGWRFCPALQPTAYVSGALEPPSGGVCLVLKG